MYKLCIPRETLRGFREMSLFYFQEPSTNLRMYNEDPEELLHKHEVNAEKIEELRAKIEELEARNEEIEENRRISGSLLEGPILVHPKTKLYENLRTDKRYFVSQPAIRVRLKYKVKCSESRIEGDWKFKGVHSTSFLPLCEDGCERGTPDNCECLEKRIRIPLYGVEASNFVHLVDEDPCIQEKMTQDGIWEKCYYVAYSHILIDCCICYRTKLRGDIRESIDSILSRNRAKYMRSIPKHWRLEENKEFMHEDNWDSDETEATEEFWPLIGS